jgi:hypothetical protein
MTLKTPSPDDDWTPPAGTTKRLCPDCRNWFASRGALSCPTCLATAGKTRKRTVSVYDPFIGASSRPAASAGSRARVAR